MTGIKWHLINNWEGHGFRSHTFAARVPGGALIKTTERFLAAVDLRQEIGAGADDLEHITSALVFVPGLCVTKETAASYAELSRLEAVKPSTTVTFKATRTDPELDAEDLEPKPSNRWAGLSARFRKLGI